MRTVLRAFGNDVRHAVRAYRRTPFFTIVAVATLTLGIGSTTTIFSVLDAVVLRPLPYTRLAELVAVAQLQRETGALLPVSPPNFFDLQEQSRVLGHVAAYGTPRLNISGAGGDPEKILAASCSHELFTVLGVTPAIGRSFTADDTAPGAPRIAVIGHGLWQRRFAGDVGILGRELLLDNAPTVIVGVMPPAFDFPARGTDLWVPLRLSRTQPPNPGIPAAAYREYRILSVVARLRPRVPLDAARQEAMRLGDALAREYPDANHGLTLAVTPLQDDVVGPARAALLIVFAAVACLLLIACANVSGLILVRAAARSRELAVRRAIGASPGRLVGQMLTESAVLAVAGGVSALLFSSWALDAFVWLAPAGIPRLENVRLDTRVAAFAIMVATAAGLLFGLVPALQVHGRVEQDALRSGRGMVTGAHRRTRHALVVVEVALSTMLLVGGSLLIQSFVRLSRVDTGLRPAAAVAVDRIELPARAQPRSGAFFDQLLARLRDAPGIDAAGATIGVPLDPRGRFFVDDSTFSIARRPLAPVGQRPAAALHVVSGDYFAAAGIPVKRGRTFDARDRHDASGVVVINEAMARRYWPSEEPIGQTLTHDLTILPDQIATRQVVGIVGNVRHFGLEQPSEPQMFIPHLQMPWPSMALVLRTALPVERVNSIVSDAVHGLDATLPVPPARRMDQVMSDALGQPRFRAWLVGLFAGAAWLLAMVGLYGTVAFMVHQRTRELGLRMALGASPQQTMSLVLSFGLKLAGAGAALGLISAVAATRLLATMLFGVGPTDPATFIAAPLSIVVVAGVACYLPVRRIRRIEAWKALNDDLA